jgi:hypothetical protein
LILAFRVWSPTDLADACYGSDWAFLAEDEDGKVVEAGACWEDVVLKEWKARKERAEENTEEDNLEWHKQYAAHFMKKKLAELRAADPEENRQERFKRATEMWKSHKVQMDQLVRAEHKGKDEEEHKEDQDLTALLYLSSPPHPPSPPSPASPTVSCVGSSSVGFFRTEEEEDTHYILGDTAEHTEEEEEEEEDGGERGKGGDRYWRETLGRKEQEQQQTEDEEECGSSFSRNREDHVDVAAEGNGSLKALENGAAVDSWFKEQLDALPDCCSLYYNCPNAKVLGRDDTVLGREKEEGKNPFDAAEECQQVKDECLVSYAESVEAQVLACQSDFSYILGSVREREEEGSDVMLNV